MTSPSGVGRVAIIGGGVAGAAAAIRLNHLGCDVSLFERRVFPREKVCGCCLGFAGLKALDAIGLGDSVRDIGHPLTQFDGRMIQPNNRPTKRFCVPIASGRSIGRGQLDTLMLERARELGVTIHQPTEARISDSTNPNQPMIRWRPVNAARNDSQ
ncbi:MAG: FAD-dependent monooxygenase [Planctomycetota bacterium]